MSDTTAIMLVFLIFALMIPTIHRISLRYTERKYIKILEDYKKRKDESEKESAKLKELNNVYNIGEYRKNPND
jgi:hypothetical protein